MTDRKENYWYDLGSKKVEFASCALTSEHHLIWHQILRDKVVSSIRRTVGRTDIEILGIRVLGRSLFSRRFSLLFHGLGIHGLERTLEQFSRHVCFRQNFTRHEFKRKTSVFMFEVSGLSGKSWEFTKWKKYNYGLRIFTFYAGLHSITVNL